MNRTKWFKVLFCCALWLGVVGEFWAVLGHEFINYDDPDYVTQNAWVQKGVTWDGIRWAFTTASAGNWHPLSWISHMVDCEFFGMNAGLHHLSSVLFHASNSVLLFLLLLRMTGALWRSACVAALFAFHPLHVESVAWVAERKDVLSTFFGFLTILCYVFYAKKPSVGRLATTATLFALSLMAKPMLVTLPFVLLLLDIWPLERKKICDIFTKPKTLKPLVVEKLPLFVLSVGMCAATLWAQQKGHAIMPMERLPLASRISNMFLSYCDYLLKTVCPTSLSIFYPHPIVTPTSKLLASILILTSISALAWGVVRKRPYILIGWCWFLGTLIPVIGLVQVGQQAMADRYTYLPIIGLFIVIVWGCADSFTHQGTKKSALFLAATLGLFSCVIVSHFQLRHWKSTEAVFSHANEVSSGNFVAKTVLGTIAVSRGNLDQAMNLYRSALVLKPDYAEAYLCLGVALGMKNKLKEAENNYREALHFNQYHPLAHKNLGIVLILAQKWEEAELHLSQALGLDPRDNETRAELAVALLNLGRFDEAIFYAETALAKNPNLVSAHVTLANSLIMKGDFVSAIEHFRTVLRLNPDSVDAMNRLAWVFSTNKDPKFRNGSDAVQLAQRACDLTSNKDALSLITLSIALAETREFANATDAAQKAFDIAQVSGQKAILGFVEKLLPLYRSRNPYRE